MKNVRILVCALAFVSAAGFAQAPSMAPLSNEVLAAILSPLAATGSTFCPTTSQGKVLFAATEQGGGESTMSACSATANCASGYGTVYCEGNTSCTAYDRSCPGEQGHVTCDGVTTWCPTVACPCSGGPIQCNNCNTCNQTGDCFACCVCNGGSLYWCSQVC